MRRLRWRLAQSTGGGPVLRGDGLEEGGEFLGRHRGEALRHIAFHLGAGWSERPEEARRHAPSVCAIGSPHGKRLHEHYPHGDGGR